MKGYLVPVLWVLGGLVVLFGLYRGIGYLLDAQNRAWEAQKDEDLNGPCHDTSTLLATTAGSPNALICTNRRHRMHVQVATRDSREEAAALVFCECVKDGGR